MKTTGRLQSFLRCAPLIVAAWLAAAPASGQSSDTAPTPAEIDRWIAQLGDDNFAVRQTAAERLTAGGTAARAALGKLVDEPDPEVRAAARRLVALIEQDEFSRRLADFAADVDGRRGATLPGWKEFSQLIGDDAAARALFVEMQREEGALLARTFDSAAATRAMIWEEQMSRLTRARGFNLGQSAGPLGVCATQIFLGSLPEADLTDDGGMRLAQLVMLPPVNEVLVAKPANDANDALRRLVCAWIVHCPNRSEPVLHQRLAIMLHWQFAEALPLAIEILERDPKYLTINPSLQVLAIMAVAKFGSEDNITLLEPWLDDHTEFVPKAVSNGLRSVQVRDAALAALLHLTDQELTTYGFLNAQAHPQEVFDMTSLYLENDERRAAAAEQWRAWRAQHKLQPPRPASS